MLVRSWPNTTAQAGDTAGLQGHVRLIAGDNTWEGKPGDYVVIPPRRHSLQAVDDSVVMLTVFKSLPSA